MTPLERRCRWRLFAYPAWYRRDRAGEMLGTLLEASGPGQCWPSLRDARALVTGGLRVRGWTWSLSMLWVVAGIVATGYDFYLTTKPYTWADVGIGIQGWSADPVGVQIAVALATAASLALPIPALIAGFIRLRGWPRDRTELPCDPQPRRRELGRAGNLCRVAGARSRNDLNIGRASPPLEGARYEQPSWRRS
jgi:hypothetical protein